MAVKKETTKKVVEKKPVTPKKETVKKTPVKKTPTKKKPTKKKVESDITYIYGIYLSGELCYVGSSGNFEQRKQKHLDDLIVKKAHSNKTLSKLFLEDSNIEIKIIHTIPTGNSLVKMMLEMNTISQLNPKANKCVYQVGFARLVFKKSPPDLAEKIVNLILDYYKEI